MQTESDLVEQAVRSLSRRKLVPDNAVVLREFRYRRGAQRADAVVLSKKHVIAIEVKTAKDSLKRLKSQLDRYSESFDKVVVVVDERHFKSISDYKFPNNVDLIKSGNSVKLVRRGRISNSSNAKKYANLLNDSELEMFLKRMMRKLNIQEATSEKLLEIVNAESIKEEILKRGEKISKNRYISSQSSSVDAISSGEP